MSNRVVIPLDTFKDGVVIMGTFEACHFGLTKDIFSEDSYFWKEGNVIKLPMLHSNHPGQGNVQKCIKHLLGMGYIVHVPSIVSNVMLHIVKKMGFKMTLEYDEWAREQVEVWVKHPKE